VTDSSQHEDARYAEVLSFPNGRELARRLPPLVLGLFLLGFGIAISLRAELGVAPWDVFHQGLAEVTGLSFGIVVVLVGLGVLLAWLPLRQRMGPGTIVNALSIGFIADLGLYLIPEQHRLAVRIPFLFGSVVLFGAGAGLYIGAGLGPGPRDGLMTAITARGHRLWIVRTVLECSVMAIGFVLGGHIGVGTVLLAFAIGPATHAGLRRFHLPVQQNTPEVLGE
jgi:uncharacterized membrane protein YczE